MENLVFCIQLFNPHQLTPSMLSPDKNNAITGKVESAD